MVSSSARDCFRSGFSERLKRMDNETVCMRELGDLDSLRKTEIAPFVCASKVLFCGLTLVMDARVLRAFAWSS